MPRELSNEGFVLATELLMQPVTPVEFVDAILEHVTRYPATTQGVPASPCDCCGAVGCTCDPMMLPGLRCKTCSKCPGHCRCPKEGPEAWPAS